MLIQVIKDGPKNFSIMVKGFTTGEFKRTQIIDLDKMSGPREGWKGVRLDSAAWAIQEKMGLHLWWEDDDAEHALALVMESRNAMRFDEGLPSPRVSEKWGKKMYLSSFKFESVKPCLRAAYFVLLDFDKQ